MKLEVTRSMADENWRYLTNWSERVFPDEGLGIQWAECRWHILAYDDDNRPVSHLAFDRFELVADQQTMPVTGVGGVLVRPEYQGQGVPAELFDKLHSSAPPITGSPLFALFCPERLVSYYQRHGYSAFSGEVILAQKPDHRFRLMTHGQDFNPTSVEIPDKPW